MYSFSYIVFKNNIINLSVFCVSSMLFPFKFPPYQIQFELKVKNKISDPLFSTTTEYINDHQHNPSSTQTTSSPSA